MEIHLSMRYATATIFRSISCSVARIPTVLMLDEEPTRSKAVASKWLEFSYFVYLWSDDDPEYWRCAAAW
jgi:hypothetical protein